MHLCRRERSSPECSSPFFKPLPARLGDHGLLSLSCLSYFNPGSSTTLYGLSRVNAESTPKPATWSPPTMTRAFASLKEGALLLLCCGSAFLLLTVMLGASKRVRWTTLSLHHTNSTILSIG